MAVSGVGTSFSLPVSWPHTSANDLAVSCPFTRLTLFFLPFGVAVFSIRRRPCLDANANNGEDPNPGKRTVATSGTRDSARGPFARGEKIFKAAVTDGGQRSNGNPQTPGMCCYGKKQKIIQQKHVTFCPEGKPEKSATIPYILADSTVCTHEMYGLYTIRPSGCGDVYFWRRLPGPERKTGTFFTYLPGEKRASCRIRFRSISHDKPATRNTAKRSPSRDLNRGRGRHRL